MPVVVIDTIKPKNNLTFPIVEDVDVLIKASGARLSEVVANMATAEQIAALQTAIAGKASIESVTALTSLVNTKADAADLTALSATVEGKASQTDLEALQADVADKADAADLTALEAEIDTKAAASDLATTNATVATKANASDVATETASLQAQIDAIVTPATQDAEVQNARVGVDGTSYASLKSRLDTEIDKTIRERGTPSDTNCNLLLNNGVYQVNASYQNTPADMSENGILTTFTSGNKTSRLAQIIFQYGAANAWIRFRTNSGFSDWAKIAWTSDINALATNSLSQKELTSSSDLNNVGTGIYTKPGDMNVQNAPSTKCTVLSTSYAAGNQKYQLAFDGINAKVFFRYYHITDGWSTWSTVLQEKDFNELFKENFLPEIQKVFADKFDIEQKNLFDGEYVTGIKLGGSGGESFNIEADASFESLAIIPVQPNTYYSIIVEDGGAESGFYYFKVATIQREVSNPLSLIGMVNTRKFENTTSYQKNITIQTGADDKCLLVQAAKATQPFLQVHHGVLTDFTVSTYAEGDNYDVTEKEVVKKLSIKYVNANSYLIKFGDYNIDLFHTESVAADQNNWNIGTIRKGGNIIVPTGTDIIGPIKLQGDADFISGVHGSSTTTVINVLCDGIPVTLNSDLNASCDKITIQLVDECRRENNQNHVFDRLVSIEFTANKIHVMNTYKSVSETELTVERATNGGLIAVRNNILNSASMNNTILSSPPTAAINNGSKYNTCAIFNTNYGDITVRNIHGYESSTYGGSFAVFTNESPMRTKSYFDIMNNETVTTGQEIAGEFEYVFS